MDFMACYLFQGLPQSQLKRIGAIITEHHIKIGDWLFHEGKPANSLYLLIDGDGGMQ